MKFRDIPRKFAAGGIASGVIIALLVIILSQPTEHFRDFLFNMLKPEAPDVIITEAVDENNHSVSANGETPSQIITFYFRTEKVDEDNNHVNIECTMDEKTSPCMGKIKYPGLDIGHHDFEVRANDQNVKESSPTTFTFAVVQSITVRGIVLKNDSGIRNATVVMDNTRQSTDDTGRFAFPFVLTREDILHTFTISVANEKGQELQCENKKMRLSPIGGITDLTFNIENYRCSNVAPITTHNKSDTFKPEPTLGYGRIDLLYNSTLVRKPTTHTSTDGLWKVSLHIDGADISNVSKVKYYLDRTFAPNNVVEVTSKDNPKFALDLSAYGGFKMYAKVYCHCLKQDTLNSTRYVSSPDAVLDLTRYILLR
jgi:hypothetical protein